MAACRTPAGRERLAARGRRVDQRNLPGPEPGAACPDSRLVRRPAWAPRRRPGHVVLRLRAGQAGRGSPGRTRPADAVRGRTRRAAQPGRQQAAGRRRGRRLRRWCTGWRVRRCTRWRRARRRLRQAHRAAGTAAAHQAAATGQEREPLWALPTARPCPRRARAWSGCRARCCACPPHCCGSAAPPTTRSWSPTSASPATTRNCAGTRAAGSTSSTSAATTGRSSTASGSARRRSPSGTSSASAPPTTSSWARNCRNSSTPARSRSSPRT